MKGKYLSIFSLFLWPPDLSPVETYMHGRYITGGESCSPLVSSLFVVVCERYMIPSRAGGVGSRRLRLLPRLIINASLAFMCAKTQTHSSGFMFLTAFVEGCFGLEFLGSFSIFIFLQPVSGIGNSCSVRRHPKNQISF